VAALASGAAGVTPRDVWFLDWLQGQAWNRRLARRELRQLQALELRCAGALNGRYWPPMIRHRRLRVIERIGRVRLVLEARSELAALLVRRVRALAPPLRPCPPHGSKCPPGCLECAAIWAWRAEYAVLSGLDRGESGYLFP
jgi:hypothetical protein